MNRGFLISKLVFLADPGKNGLSGHEKIVLLAIADHLGKKEFAWPGYGTIAHKSGVGRRTAIRTVAKLVEREILVREYGDGQDSNRYQISVEKLLGLITNRKYQRQAAKLTSTVVNVAVPTITPVVPAAVVAVTDGQCEQREQVMNERTSVTVTLPLVSGRHHPSVTVTPERINPTRSKNGPIPNPEGDRSLNGRGEGVGYPDSVSDFIHVPELSQRVRDLEAQLLCQTSFRYSSTLKPEVLAPRVGKLFKDWKTELGTYPENWMIASVLASKQFLGIQNLNWGLLTSKKGKGTPYRDRLFQGVIDQFRDHRAANASNAGSARPARVADPENDPTYCIGSDW